jgi:hypothetical protein
MSCKLVIRRYTEGKDFRGDVVNAYPHEVYLGNLVEPQGGAFVIVEVMDCDYMHDDIQAFVEPFLISTTHNKYYGIKDPAVGSNYYNELITTGRIRTTLKELLENRVER